MAGNPMARFGKPDKKDDKLGSGGLYGYLANRKGGESKPEYDKRTGRSQGGSTPTPSPRSSGSPRSGVSAAAQAKADKAKASAKRYAEVQRAANKAKRAVLSRKGPQDLAGRTQREMDLKRYRELQKGADKWKDKARSQGLRFGGDKPSGKGSTPTPRSTGTGRSGGSTPASSAVSRATSGGGSAGKGGSAPKVGAVLSRARKMKKETTGTPITAKELKNFMAYYDKTHKGSLSRSDAVLMARMLKSKSPKVAKRYGLNVSLEN